MKAIERIRANAALAPEAAAYISGEEMLTRGQLWEAARRIADGIAERTDRPVMIYGSKEGYMPAAMLACLIAGVPYVPVDIFTPAARIALIAETAGCELAVTEYSMPGLPLTVCRPEELSSAPTDERETPDSRTAYIIFTSGSTGRPKGVPISRANLDNFIGWIGSLPPLDGLERARVLGTASFSFDLSVADFYYALCCGHTLCEPKKADGAVALMRQAGAEAAVMTPTMAKLCMLDPDFCGRECPKLKCIYFCGETLEPGTAKKLFARFPGLSILNAYGPTEATSAVCASLITEKDLKGAVLPCGDLDSAACMVGIADGEIVLRGDSVFYGYLGSAEGGHFTENGVNCYATGDAGSIKDGRLYFGGRRDRQVKYKGFRIELDEVENALLTLPGVDDCAVVARRGPAGEVKSLKAFICGKADPDGARAALAGFLPEYMIPKTVAALDRLPVTPNGKTDRKALEEL